MLGRLSTKSQSNKPKSQKQPASASVAAPPPQTKSAKPAKQSASIKTTATKQEPTEKPAKKQQSQSIKQPTPKSEPVEAVEPVQQPKQAKQTKQVKSTSTKAPTKPKQEPKQEVVPMVDESADEQADVDMKPQTKPRESRAAKRNRERAEAVEKTENEDVMDSNEPVAEVEERGVVFISHLPHGFEEKQIKSFMRQFGSVKHVRLSRNKKTGKSKHYAFIEFDHPSVAQVVADSMHRYMMYGHTLEAHVMPTDKIHPDLFKHADKGFKFIPYDKIARRQYNQPRTVEQQQHRISKLLMKEEKKREALREAGIVYNFPGFQAELSAAV